MLLTIAGNDKSTGKAIYKFLETDRVLKEKRATVKVTMRSLKAKADYIFRDRMICSVKSKEKKCALLAEEKLKDQLYALIAEGQEISLLDRYGFLLADAHGDSLGNKGSIYDGECQWMTAGSGIIHQEMPKPSDHMLGAQLWINLPARDKMTAPKYGDIKKEDVPVIREDGTEVHLIAGKYLENSGAFKGSFVDATYLDVDMEPGSSWQYESEEGSTLFVYIVKGSAAFVPEGEEMDARQALLFGEGRRIAVKAGSSGVRFLLLTAQPLNEPIAWGGPIVMNTDEELNKAFEELDNDTFIK